MHTLLLTKLINLERAAMSSGEFVGLDVKVMRTQKQEGSTDHLLGSRKNFERILAKVRSVDTKLEQQFIENRDYEGLDQYILSHLMGCE